MRGTAPALAASLALAIACAPKPAPSAFAAPDAFERVESGLEDAAAELSREERARLRHPEHRDLFRTAARDAWSYVDRSYVPSTGFNAPLQFYPYATIWDVGSMMAALYSARALELVEAGTYQARMTTLLATLGTVPLYGGRLFNKSYDTRTGAMIDARSAPPGGGLGWSATDLGRLLMWLKIVAQADPGHARQIDAIMARNDFASVVRNGYLWGEDYDAQGRPHSYQEGRIGYEQYAARGFAAWGFRAVKALSLTENAVPVTVNGQVLPADARRWDRLTNEPFLLLGLEAGWDRQTAAVVRRLLRAQEARFHQTGLMTIGGEDSIDLPPHYFYYYCVYTNGKTFGVDVQDRRASVDGPRWVSTKSALAFHTLMPSRYTEQALQALAAARSPQGWASGVYEGSGRSTGNLNINTAAVILSAALYNERGAPLLMAEAGRDPAGR